MPRKKLTQKEKDAMQSARAAAKEAKAQATSALNANVDQFSNMKFWKNVDPAVAEGVATAIEKSAKSRKRAEIKELEQRLATLKSQ